jgi:hypothetical protein
LATDYINDDKPNMRGGKPLLRILNFTSLLARQTSIGFWKGICGYLPWRSLSSRLK